MRAPLARFDPPLLSRQRGCVAAWHAGGLYGPSLTSDGKLRDFISNQHHAQFGSGSGADSNDPLQLLPYLGRGYLYQTGVSGNYASVPDEAALRFSGDCRIEGLLTADTSVLSAVAGKYASSTQGYVLRIETSGSLRFQWYDSGTSAARTLTSSTTVTFGATPLWVAVDFDANDGAGNCAATFYTSADGASWTQLGTVRTSGTTATIATGNEVFTCGAYGLGTSAVLVGPLHKVRAYNQMGGSAGKVIDVDFTNLASYNATRTSLTATTGQTVTINRSTSGRKAVVVDRPLYLLGTDDYFEVPDHADLDIGPGVSFTLAAAVRLYGSAGARQAIVAKKEDATSGSAGYHITRETSGGHGVRVSDGTTQVLKLTPSPTGGAVQLVAHVVRRPSQYAVLDGATTAISAGNDISAVGSLANSLPLRIGASSAASAASFLDGEFFAGAIFRRALSDPEIRQLNRELLGIPV